MLIENYDEWLALPDDLRQKYLASWNAYAHEMFWIPMTAAARLASTSTYPVTDINVGIYHGGAYVLQLTVANEYLPFCPKPLTQTFDGFPVIWLGNRYEVTGNPQPFVGTWETRDAFAEYRILVNDSDGLSVACTDLRSNVALMVCDARITLDQLTFVTRSENQTLFHSLRLDDGNVLNYQITLGQLAYRADSGEKR